MDELVSWAGIWETTVSEDEARHTFSRTAELFGADPILSATIVGHLLVEAMLADLIRTAVPAPEPASMFSAKVRQLESLELLDEAEAEALRAFNRIRNQFAHELDYELDFETVFNLVGKLGAAGFDGSSIFRVMGI